MMMTKIWNWKSLRIFKIMTMKKKKKKKKKMMMMMMMMKY